jgi:tetratricopeptide (TPR) repeat protein
MAMFRILGPVRLLARGRNVDLGPPKVRGLLGILLLHADSAVPIDMIVEGLWDASDETGNGVQQARHQPPPNPRKTLQGYVSKLRAKLKTGSVPAEVRTEHGSYRLKIDRTIVDIHQFRQVAAEGRAAARRGDHAAAVTAFEAAIDLWHGPPLADLQSSWSIRNGTTLTTNELLPAYLGLLQAHADLGNYDEVLARLRSPMLMAYELEDSVMALHLRALAAVDGPSSVVTSFRDYTRKLDDVLDARPSADLVQLYQTLTQQHMSPTDDAPPWRPPQQLPRDIANFLGRTDILRQLDDLLAGPDAQPAVVSLDGGPGVGKTAIATHWAHRSQDRFTDGVLYADLNGYSSGSPTSPATVLATFLNALGIPHDQLPHDAGERAALLRRELTGRRTLVVLDNARDSGHVRPLLAATSPSPVLITSRQRLAYRDSAHRITVPTLLVDEAIAILQRGIGQARVVDDLAAVHELAALCCGIPLALCIAADHVSRRPDTPLPDLVQHLHSRHRLLDAGSHTGDPDLRAVFGWSIDALPTDAERLFSLLGLHPSTQVSTQAAAALAGWPFDRTERAFDRLVDAHLSQQHRVDTYRTHDLLHDYAGDRAESRFTQDDRRAAVHRQVDWYLATSDAAVAKVNPQRRPVPRLEPTTTIQPQSFADDQEALHWCVRERRQVVAVTWAAIDYQFHDHAWRLIATFDDILNRFGDPGEVMDVHRAALDSARIAGSRHGESCLLNNIGAIVFLLGHYENAARSYAQALAIARETDDETGESQCLFNIGTTLLRRGIYQPAISYFGQSLAIAERLDDKTVQARVYQRLGELYQLREQSAEAERFFERSLAIQVQTNDLRNQAATLATLGELRIEGGDPRRAIEYCERSLHIGRDSYDDRKTAEALAVRGAAQYQLGAHGESLTSAQEAAELCHAMNDARGEARALAIMAQAQQAIGDAPAADDSRTRALALIESSDDPMAARIRAAVGPTRSSAHTVPGQRENSTSRPANRH